MRPESNTRACIAIAAVFLMIATGLAGCVGGSGGATDADDADDVDDNEDPTNVTEVQNKTKNSTIKVRRGTDLDPNSTYHTHDSWGDRTEITILDPDRDDAATQTIDYQSFYADCVPFCNNDPTLVFDIPQRKEGDDLIANTVFQGTGKITLTLSWEGQAAVGEPTLCVTNDAAVVPCGNPDAEFTFSESGETKTIEFGGGLLGKESWDPPHARKSNWRFGVKPCETQVGACTPALQQTDFTLTVTIHRGDHNLPLDPPHFSFYGAKDKLTLLDGYLLNSGRVLTADDWYFQERGSSKARPIWPITWEEISDAGSDHRVVAPGTAEMRVRVEWEDGQGDPQETPLELKYLSASDPWGDWKEPGDVQECEGNLTNCKVYTIAVDGLGADSLYAIQTQWQWALFMGSGGSPEGMMDSTVEVSIDIFKEARR